MKRTRRELLKDTGTVAAGAAVLSLPGATSAFARKRRRRQTVAIFGGGVAGLTAAHELIERGFDVTVFERRRWGGKCFSSEVADSGRNGRRGLPGEHAYRVPFGFYANLPETMRRIPFEQNPNGVFDNLVEQTQVVFFRDHKTDLPYPIASLNPRSITPEQILELIVAAGVEMELPLDAAATFGRAVLSYFCSCEARRHEEWENISWLEAIEADRFGEDYRRTLGAIPQFTQASHPKDTSANYIANFFESTVFNVLGRGANGPWLRILDGPTNERWIDPWVTELRRLGVRLRLGDELKRIHYRDGRIRSVEIAGPRRRRELTFDHYISALPVERARKLWTKAMRRDDRDLARMDNLQTAWMNGISYFLTERSNLVEGIGVAADSPWAASFIPQGQYWEADFSSTYGDGTVVDKISAAIADWTAPGTFIGRPAEDCSPEQVAEELWEQIKLAVNDDGSPPKLTDAMLHSYEIDPGMLVRDGRLVSGDPLVLPTKGTERFRPPSRTRIENLSLAGDYISRDWIITTMEAANHAGKMAASAAVERLKPNADPVPVIAPYQAPEFAPLKAIDEDRYRRGLPNALDTA